MNCVRKRATLVFAALALAMLGGAGAEAQPGPAVSIVPYFNTYIFGSFGGIPITYGWSFETHADLTISQLGYYDGMPYWTGPLNEPHVVGIFDSDGALVVSATVPAGTAASLVDNFWYVDIPPTRLPFGKTFTIGAYLPAPKLDLIIYTDVPPGEPPLITFDSRITWRQGVSDYPGGPELAFPTSPCCGTLLGFFGPSFVIASSREVPVVAIDIRPGSFPNVINLRSNGVVPVAILGAAGFDALQVKPASLRLSGASVKTIGKGQYSCHAEDVNGDGRTDLVCQFVTSQLTLAPGATLAVLEGELNDGTRIRGEDSVQTVPH